MLAVQGPEAGPNAMHPQPRPTKTLNSRMGRPKKSFGSSSLAAVKRLAASGAVVGFPSIDSVPEAAHMQQRAATGMAFDPSPGDQARMPGPILFEGRMPAVTASILVVAVCAD